MTEPTTTEPTDQKIMLTTVTETTFGQVADAIVAAVTFHEDLADFVMVLDEAVADLDFTREVHRRLGEAIAEEEKALEESTAGGSDV